MERVREKGDRVKRDKERKRETEVTEYCRVSTPKSWVG